MDSYNSQQMDHKKWYICTLVGRQVSVLAKLLNKWNCGEDGGYSV